MEWVDGNLGSKLTMKYPAIWLMGPRAHGEVLSIAFAGAGQHQDAGGKVVHVAPDTTSVITSKSISKNGGRAGYRGLLEVAKGATNSKSKVVCDALILDEDSRSDTYPYIQIDEDEVDIGHEATVSKIGEEQLFYLMSRGLTETAGERDGRLGLRRADHQGAAARVRDRDEPPDRAADGRVCWVADARRQPRYAELPVPDTTEEAWRFTDLRGLRPGRLRAGRRRRRRPRRRSCSTSTSPGWRSSPRAGSRSSRPPTGSASSR